MTGAQKPREEDAAESVLKEKRTTSKAEYVNTANQIYVKPWIFFRGCPPDIPG